MSSANDLIPSYSFEVTLDCITFSFSKVTNISGSVEIEPILEGGNNSAPIIVPKPKENLTFKTDNKPEVSTDNLVNISNESVVNQSREQNYSSVNINESSENVLNVSSENVDYQAAENLTFKTENKPEIITDSDIRQLAEGTALSHSYKRPQGAQGYAQANSLRPFR